MIKLIIFDLDDTLVDSFETNFRAYEEACRLESIKISRKKYREIRGLAWQDSIPIFAKTKDSQTIYRIHENKKRFFEQFIYLSKKIENNIALKDLLKEKYTLCIATSASKQNALAILSNAEIINDFKFIVTAEDVSKGKPEPELFLKCANIEGINPRECFVIDDSDNGIEAAKKAKMPRFKVTSS